MGAIPLRVMIRISVRISAMIRIRIRISVMTGLGPVTHDFATPDPRYPSLIGTHPAPAVMAGHVPAIRPPTVRTQTEATRAPTP